MSLLVKANLQEKLVANITPQSAGWQYVGFSALVLADAQDFTFTTESDRELCITVLTGFATIEVDGQVFEKIGKRQSVFEECAPYAVYVPPGKNVSIKALGHAEFGLSTAPAKGLHPVRLIKPEDMKRHVRGKGTNTRYICDILPETDMAAESLLITEVITPSGHTSSYPPHKHDTSADNETHLEETYYHRLNPPQGFAFQRIYTDDRSIDESHAVENHDVVLAPKGYHPCGTVHGYDLYYLNTMAGPERRWAFHNDPQHEWLFK